MADSKNWNEDLQANYGRALARAWADADYKAKLLSEPRAALADVGIEVPARVNVNVAEVDAENVQLTLPPAPEGEITDEALQGAVGGFCNASSCSCSCNGVIVPPGTC